MASGNKIHVSGDAELIATLRDMTRGLRPDVRSAFLSGLSALRKGVAAGAPVGAKKSIGKRLNKSSSGSSEISGKVGIHVGKTKVPRNKGMNRSPSSSGRRSRGSRGQIKIIKNKYADGGVIHARRRARSPGRRGKERPVGGSYSNREPHAHLIELGTANRWTKRGAFRGRVTPQPFVRRTAENTSQKVMWAIERQLEKRWQRYLQKKAASGG